MSKGRRGRLVVAALATAAALLGAAAGTAEPSMRPAVPAPKGTSYRPVPVVPVCSGFYASTGTADGPQEAEVALTSTLPGPGFVAVKWRGAAGDARPLTAQWAINSGPIAGFPTVVIFPGLSPARANSALSGSAEVAVSALHGKRAFCLIGPAPAV
ncbi:MAG TPA: hypothetical protein VMV23_00190 [Candidatus Nanopelagicaceae bacterium]|nr:hypothetical protein [Candidatus Nanopelagicaceae bacterium]